MIGGMAVIKKEYLVKDPGPDGVVRWYVRMKGQRKIRIKEEVGSPEFDDAYHDAINELKKRIADGAEGEMQPRIKPGTLDWLILKYYRSGKFLEAAEATQTQRKSILNRIRSESGEKDYRTVTRRAVRNGRDKRAETHGAANNYLKAVKALYKWAMEEDYVDHNPAVGVARVKTGKSSWKSWPIEICLKFERAHEIGTTARLVYDLALYGGLRRSDIVRIGKQNIQSDGSLFLAGQKKGDEPLHIPIFEPLRISLQATPRVNLNVMSLAQTKYGKAFSEKGLGGRFHKWCVEAGIPDGYSLHGLRKALGSRLAESGATEEEIAAALGHVGTKSVKHYTVGARKRRLADAAFRKLREQSVQDFCPDGVQEK